MPRSKKQVILEQPEALLRRYAQECSCRGDQYGSWGPCELCKIEHQAVLQVKRMREELLELREGVATFEDRARKLEKALIKGVGGLTDEGGKLRPYNAREAIKRVLDSIEDYFKKEDMDSRAKSLDDVTPEEWDTASRRNREQEDQKRRRIRARTFSNQTTRE